MAAQQLPEGGDPLSGQSGDRSRAQSISNPGANSRAKPNGPIQAHAHAHAAAPTPSYTQAHAAHATNAAPPEPAPKSRVDHAGVEVSNITPPSSDSSSAPAEAAPSSSSSLKRKASPTMSSASAASAARAAKMTRIRKACDICRMRKVKCDGVSPCKPCQALGAQCTFQYISRHRGPVSRFAGGGWSDTAGESASTTAATSSESVSTTAGITPPTGTEMQMDSPVNMTSSPGLNFNHLYAPVYLPQPMTLPQAPLLPDASPQLSHQTMNSIDSIDSMDHALNSAILNNNQNQMDIHTTQAFHIPTPPLFPAAPPVISYSTSYFDINGQPQINIYPRMPRPPELQATPRRPQPPPPPPPPPPSATDAIAPFHVLELLVDDFFTYIHPLIPFPHEPTFRRRFADPQERQSPRCLALLASMIGCLAASFPRSVRAHLRTRHNNESQHGNTGGSGKFARAICMVECCRDVAMTARGAKFYIKPMLNVDDAATSYFLGLAAGYTFDWRLCRRFMAESMSFVQELGFHRPAGQAASAVNTMAPAAIGAATAAAAGVGAGVSAGSGALSALYTAPPPFNHVDDQIGKRIFWILYLAMRSLIQLGATLSETPLPPFNNARPFPELPAEVDDAYIEADVIHAQPQGTVSLITGFNKTIQIYATMDPIATMDYACGLNQVPPAAQRAMFVEALKAANVITDTLPDELYLPLPGSADASTSTANTTHIPQPNEIPNADTNGNLNGNAGSDSSTPIEMFYDDLSGYRYYPPTEDENGRPSPSSLRRSSSVSSQSHPNMTYMRYPGQILTPTSNRRPDDLRQLLGKDPARRRQVQYDIQKTNIYASQLATRSYFVEMYHHLNERTKGREGEAEVEIGDSPVAGERERIVHSLLFVLAAIPQYNMEPNGSALINKIRQVASTILGAGAEGAQSSEGANGSGGTKKSPMEAQLIRFLEILIRLEKTGGPGRPSTSAASTISSEEDFDEEEELQNWASLREEQMRFAANGGFLNDYV